MKKLAVLTTYLFFTLMSCTAQQTQTRTAQPFDKIQVNAGISVVYTNSDTLSLSLKGKSSALENIETRFENATLVISSKGNISSSVVIYISNSSLNYLEVGGAADFKSGNTIQSEKLTVSASGSSNVHLKVNSKSVNSYLAGASNVVLKGETDSLTAEISGASTFKAYGLSSKNARVVTAGAAVAKVNATETLKANATGASEIKIKGDPKEFAAEASSAANITKVREAGDGTGSKIDTTTYNFSKKKILVITDGSVEENDDSDLPTFKHWKGFSMGVNGYVNNAMSFKMQPEQSFMDLNYSRSFNFQFNLIERHFNIAQDYFKIVTGFGFDYHIYAFSGRTNLNPDTSFTHGIVDANSNLKYLRNKFRCTYLQVPLLLEFNTSLDPNKTFHIAFGVIGQYLISSRTKQVLEDNGYDFERVNKDNYNLSPFAAKAHVNLGYRGFNVFAEYGLTELFQPAKGPELYPFTAGIRLVPFG